MKSILIFLTAITWFTTSERAPETKFPVPPVTANTLFYIQRSSNTNTVMYEVNREGQQAIDSKNPVQVFWIRYAERGQRQGLNYLERTLAYGVRCEPANAGKFMLRFVASKKRWAEISLGPDGRAQAVMLIGKKMSQLHKIFVQVAETSWLPKVQYVEFFGEDVATHQPTYEKMII